MIRFLSDILKWSIVYSTSELMSLVVCLISKGVETISPKGRMIATILLPLETSIPTAFINLSLLKIIDFRICFSVFGILSVNILSACEKAD